MNPAPLTVSVVSAEFTNTYAGDTAERLGAGYVSDTVAEADFVLSAWLVAVTVTEEDPLGTRSGAV